MPTGGGDLGAHYHFRLSPNAKRFNGMVVSLVISKQDFMVSLGVELQNNCFADTAVDPSDTHPEGDDERPPVLARPYSIVELMGQTISLDVCSRTVRVLRPLTDERDIQVVETEPAKGMREQGSSAAGLADSNAEVLDFPNDLFDPICKFTVLHHSEDCENAVAEMCRVAKYGVHYGYSVFKNFPVVGQRLSHWYFTGTRWSGLNPHRSPSQLTIHATY